MSESAASVPPDRAAVLKALYQAFNDRDIDAVLAAMAPDVDWPNGWEGGRLAGRAEVRAYWERQWAQIRPTTSVKRVSRLPDGRYEARVHLVVRDPVGTLLERSDAVHVYELDDDGLVARMESRG